MTNDRALTRLATMMDVMVLNDFVPSSSTMNTPTP